MPFRVKARRALAMLAVLIAAAAVLWLMLAYWLFQSPVLSRPHKADAVIVLAGAAQERLPVAQELMDENMAPVLAPSSTDTPGNAATDRLCRRYDAAKQALRCFTPHQMDTRSEARAVGKLIDDEGWNSVIVVTSRYHTPRAYLLIGQCTRASVQMVASNPGFGPVRWLDRYVVETGGLANALLHPACK